jgi:hypothetical protein
MLAIFDRLPAVADISTDISKFRLRQHIAKILAKIPTSKSVMTDISSEYFEAELS